MVSGLTRRGYHRGQSTSLSYCIQGVGKDLLLHLDLTRREEKRERCKRCREKDNSICGMDEDSG